MVLKSRYSHVMADSVEPKDQRINVVVSRSELEAIDDWRFTQRIASRSDAIRRLIGIGLEATRRHGKKDGDDPRR
jgi:hypothetical protein